MICNLEHASREARELQDLDIALLVDVLGAARPAISLPDEGLLDGESNMPNIVSCLSTRRKCKNFFKDSERVGKHAPRWLRCIISTST